MSEKGMLDMRIVLGALVIAILVPAGNQTGSGIVYEEKNIIKTGKVVLEMGDGIDLTVPRNHLHPLPGTLGSDLGAGLFKKMEPVFLERQSNGRERSKTSECGINEDR